MRVPSSVEPTVSAALWASNRRKASFGRTGPQNLQMSRVCSTRDADRLHLPAFGGFFGRSLTRLWSGFPVGASRLPQPKARPSCRSRPSPLLCRSHYLMRVTHSLSVCRDAWGRCRRSLGPVQAEQIQPAHWGRMNLNKKGSK